MTVCKEMQKLRDCLDEHGIEWKDAPVEYIDGTMSYMNHKHFCAANPLKCTIHGYDLRCGHFSVSEDENGLIEVLARQTRKYDLLTADEVIEMLFERGE